MLSQFRGNSTFATNNIFGNATGPGRDNCGLLNGTGQLVDATNNFWGAAPGLETTLRMRLAILALLSRSLFPSRTKSSML